MHAHDDGERPVDLRELLGDAAVAGLRKASAAVLLRHVEPEQPALAELPDLVVTDPAPLLDGALVVVLAELAGGRHELADPLLLALVGARVGEDEVLVDLAEEERLREGGDALLGLGRLLCGGGLH